MEANVGLDSPGKFTEQSTAPHGVIPAEQGRSTIDEADDDIRTHGEDLNNLLLHAYNTSHGHIIAVKKRLIEEKEIALIEAERNYLNQYDKYQNEIRELQSEIRQQEENLVKSGGIYHDLSNKSAGLLGRHHRKYSSSYSVGKIFQAWHLETKITRQTNKLDLIARTFARKYLLAKAFYGMCMSSQRRRAAKQNAEAKFKFDSVTTEVSTVNYLSFALKLRYGCV